MKIYVAMHKVIKLNIDSNIYEPLLVGSFNKKSENILRDDTGENISNKNENYCELTGIYWIWKNSKENVVGLCHYRRFLSKNPISNSQKFFLNEDDVRKDLSEGINCILPKKNHFGKKIISDKSYAPSLKDMETLRNVVSDLYPEYIKEYDTFLQEKSAYLCNIMIAPKEIYDQYCEWLFKILFEVEKVMPKEDYINDSYRKRMFGFLSERLLNIWVLHNKDKLKVKEYPLINTEATFVSRLKTYVVQTVRSIIQKKEIKNDEKI